MADEKTEKNRAVDTAISQIEKQFGKGSIMTCWGLPRTSDGSDSAARFPLSASSARAWSTTLAAAGLAPAGRVSGRLSKTWVSIKQRDSPAGARSRTFYSSAACAAQGRALLLR